MPKTTNKKTFLIARILGESRGPDLLLWGWLHKRLLAVSTNCLHFRPACPLLFLKARDTFCFEKNSNAPLSLPKKTLYRIFPSPVVFLVFISSLLDCLIKSFLSSSCISMMFVFCLEMIFFSSIVLFYRLASCTSVLLFSSVRERERKCGCIYV